MLFFSWFFQALLYIFGFQQFEHDVSQHETNIYIYSVWCSSCVWKFLLTNLEKLWPLFSWFLFSILVLFPLLFQVQIYLAIEIIIFCPYFSLFLIYILHLALCPLIYVQFILCYVHFIKSIQGIYFSEIAISSSRISIQLYLLFLSLSESSFSTEI